MFDFRTYNLIKKYNSFRGKENHGSFCNAPTTSLRFHRNGGVQFCCHHIDFQYLSQKSLKEIWSSQELEIIRKSFKKYKIPQSCNFCAIPFRSQDFTNVNALSFDYLVPNENNFPILMDFSLENTCNLACIMCDASLSSKIQGRKSCNTRINDFRYDENFIQQLLEFIPHLKYTVFTGGEPFLIKIYYDIWDQIIAINPEIKINITTNGTVFNQRIRDFLEQANVNITVSVDSFDPEIYKKIRVGAELAETLKNVYEFAEICRKKNTEFTITVCPMIINCYEIPLIVTNCNEQNWNFNYNTVLKPWNQALWSIDIDELQKIVDYYKGYRLVQNSSISEVNYLKFRSLISLLENWILRIKTFDSIGLTVFDLNEMREQLTKRFQNILANFESSQLAKVDKVVNGVPDKLIRKPLVDYVNNLSESFITKEFVENDEDTIVDHLCIVAFNL